MNVKVEDQPMCIYTKRWVYLPTKINSAALRELCDIIKPNGVCNFKIRDLKRKSRFGEFLVQIIGLDDFTLKTSIKLIIGLKKKP